MPERLYVQNTSDAERLLTDFTVENVYADMCLDNYVEELYDATRSWDVVRRRLQKKPVLTCHPE